MRNGKSERKQWRRLGPAMMAGAVAVFLFWTLVFSGNPMISAVAGPELPVCSGLNGAGVPSDDGATPLEMLTADPLAVARLAWRGADDLPRRQLGQALLPPRLPMVSAVSAECAGLPEFSKLTDLNFIDTAQPSRAGPRRG